MGSLSAISGKKVYLDTNVEASRLRAAAGGLKLPDAIHVATALKHRCEVFLSNDQSIGSVPGLEKCELQALKAQWESRTGSVGGGAA